MMLYKALRAKVVQNGHNIVDTPPTMSAMLVIMKQSAHGRSDTQPVITRASVLNTPMIDSK